MTIHPMARPPRAAAKKHSRLNDRVIGFVAIAAIAGLAAIAFASGPYRSATSTEPQTTGQAPPAPTIVPIHEAADTK